MFANENKPEFLQMAGSTRQTQWWVDRYAHLFWEIIGIGEDPDLRLNNYETSQ